MESPCGFIKFPHLMEDLKKTYESFNKRFTNLFFHKWGDSTLYEKKNHKGYSMNLRGEYHQIAVITILCRDCWSQNRSHDL